MLEQNYNKCKIKKFIELNFTIFFCLAPWPKNVGIYLANIGIPFLLSTN